MSNITVISQKNYGRIEIDNREKDIVQIWGFQKESLEVIQIERENISILIEELKKIIA